MTQEPGVKGRRRWFQGSGFELVVWLDATERLEGFQICYVGALQREHALTWRRLSGFAHNRVDTGDTRPDKNLTPILVPDGAVPWERLRREFAECSEGMEAALRDFVSARLAEGGR
ncbi:MAG: hypothetical protein QG602_2660 [Verrucomicrobiota bacterium]|nr:hypothetical protein [Verrucomicrobiota bacterium]